MEKSDCAQGYVTDATYADKFYRELAPGWINYVVKTNGGTPVDLAAHFTYLELGCGFANSTITNAGAYSHAAFYACDIIAAHIEQAQSAADECGVNNIQLLHASFDELLNFQLPAMDFIVLHGVYSWVGEQARETIKHIIDNMLKPEGIIYISYNCMPGWSTEAPLRKLLVELAVTERGDAAQRSLQAVDSMHRISEHLHFFKENPAAGIAVKSYLNESSNYLAHEFLNQAWDTFYSVDIAEEMADIDLHFLASATLVDNHPMLLFDEQTNDIVSGLASARQQQLALDFASNKRFRRDIFVKGKPLPEKTHTAGYISDLVVGCVGDPGDIKYTVRVPRGSIGFDQQFINALRDALSQGAVRMATLVQQLGGKDRSDIEIIRNVMFLVAAGELSNFVCEPDLCEVSSEPDSIFRRVIEFIIEHQVSRAIPCPMLGSGIEVNVEDAIVLNEWLYGVNNINQLAHNLANIIMRDAIKIVDNEGNAIASSELNRHCLSTAEQVVNGLVPLFVRLKLIKEMEL